MFEAKAEAKALRPRPKFWLEGYFTLEDLTSLNNNNKPDIYIPPLTG